MKRCIFHVPNYIDLAGRSGSQVRPVKMLEAFRNIGYEVDVVRGYGQDRRAAIKKIKDNIRAGVQYEFLYSESSTMPTLLTEKNHLPKYPTLDFGFFKFCRKHSIKIGLFYRDIIWRFEQYKNSVPWYYRFVTYWFYKYDLMQYDRVVDVLYLPSGRIEQYIPECRKVKKDVLMPGAVLHQGRLDLRKQHYENREQDSLNIFCVGGVSGIYDIIDMVKALKNIDYVNMTICCKKEEWEKEQERYKPYLTERIRVVHASGDQLDQYYRDTDICWCYFNTKQHRYMNIATPIKLLEYMGNVAPVIATAESCSGNFVEQYDVGWSIPYDESSFLELMDHIYHNQQEILEKHRKACICVTDNTWEKRAEKVEKDLKNGEETNEAGIIKKNRK